MTVPVRVPALARRSLLLLAVVMCLARFSTLRGEVVPFTSPEPDLTVGASTVMLFTQGVTGREVIAGVRNAGSAPTSGTATVVHTLPAGLTATNLQGTGWTCTLATLSCTRADALASGAQWPSIVLTLSIAANAPATVTIDVTVSGGGQTITTNDTAQVEAVVIAQESCGRFPEVPLTHAITTPADLATGDLDNDGNADLIVVSTNANTITPLLGNGDGTFTNATTVNFTTFPDSPVLTDFDGDGNLDVAVAVSDTNSIVLMTGNGDGTFDAAVPLTIASARFLAVSDLDHDGDADLVATTDVPAGISVLLGNGNGTFAAAVPYATATAPLAIDIGDVNRDGYEDVVAALSESNEGVGSLAVFLNDGDGTFGAPGTVATGEPSAAVIDVDIADFDADGVADLAAHVQATPNLRILDGNGDGTFAAARGMVDVAREAVVGDLNGDGHPDAVVRGLGLFPRYVLVGDGAGNLSGGLVNYEPTGVVLADFNGDGATDVAMASASSGNLLRLFVGGCPDLTVAKSHSGNFTQGQSMATYTITVSNDGTVPNDDVVTVVDSLPAGLTATAMNGSGWSCVVATVSCTRSDALAAGASYPAITLEVAVAPNTAAAIVNTVTVSGGGQKDLSNDTANDPTTVVPAPDVTAALTHEGNFAQGQNGRTYSFVVGNGGGAPTSGTVSATASTPTGLILTSIYGIGWNCSLPGATCTRSDVLAAGGTYSAITLVVTVAGDAPASVTMLATVSGGSQSFTANDVAQDPTTVLATPSNLVATAISSSEVVVTWGAVTGATHYEVFRSSGGGPFTSVGAPVTNNLNDAGRTPDTTYVYVVRALDATNATAVSNRDAATTVLFTDDPLTAGTSVMKAVHIVQLRAAVNAVRAAAGLPPATFTDNITIGSAPRAIHITELRSALAAARDALLLVSPGFTTPSLAAGAVIQAAHVHDLRLGVR